MNMEVLPVRESDVDEPELAYIGASIEFLERVIV